MYHGQFEDNRSSIPADFAVNPRTKEWEREAIYIRVWKSIGSMGLGCMVCYWGEN